MIVRLATSAMATRFELVLSGERESFLRAVGEEAIAEINRWHRALNYFASDSVVTRLNAMASSRPIHLEDDVLELFRTCDRVWRLSEGTFDVTIAPLMHQWGFRSLSPPIARGDRHSNEGSTCAFGFQHVSLNEFDRTVAFKRAGLAIDFGAVAKGWALDRAAEILRSYGIDCAFAHGGTSSAIAVGSPPDSPAGWPVAVRTSNPEDRPIVYLRDNALAVSTPRGRMIERDGERFGHIIDPRIGRPAQGAEVVAVISRSAALADAWSTAILVQGSPPVPVPSDVQSVPVFRRVCVCNPARAGGSALFCPADL